MPPRLQFRRVHVRSHTDPQRQLYVDKNVVHVGNLVGGDDYCIRQNYYAHSMGEVGYSLHSPKTLMTMYEGDYAEIQFKDLLAKAKVPMKQPAQKRLVGKIVGTPDVAFTFMRDEILGEVKSRH